jgi:hypothetical protein
MTLRDQPLAVKLAAIVLLSTLVGITCVVISYGDACAGPGRPLCGPAFMLALAFVFASYLVLPEFAIVSLVLGILHVIQHRRCDPLVAASIATSIAVLFLVVWINYHGLVR